MSLAEETKPAAAHTSPRIGVALGSGSARGLTIIPYLEALDEVGVKPSVIAGSSIGAFVGSGWAAGMSGAEIREYTLEVLGSMRAIMSRLWKAQVRGIRQIFTDGLAMQFDAENVIAAFNPDIIPETFEELDIPLRVVATDFRSWHQLVYRSGPLLPAIAGSVAIPTLFKPVDYQGHLLVDGGVVNPLPLDIAARAGAEFLIGLDVNGAPSDYDPIRAPSAIDVGLGSAQIMMNALITNTLADFPPDVYERAPVGRFGGYDYWRIREILEASDARKDGFKRDVEAALERFSAAQQRKT